MQAPGAADMNMAVKTVAGFGCYMAYYALFGSVLLPAVKWCFCLSALFCLQILPGIEDQDYSLAAL